MSDGQPQSDLELLTHKPSAWALIGLPLYALGVLMLATPWLSSTESTGDVFLVALMVMMGIAILIGALFAVAGYEGMVIRAGTRTIETWWRVLGVGRRRRFAVSDSYTVACTAQRARHNFLYIVAIVGPQRGRALEQFTDVSKARELAREIGERLNLPVRDETPA